MLAQRLQSPDFDPQQHTHTHTDTTHTHTDTTHTHRRHDVYFWFFKVCIYNIGRGKKSMVIEVGIMYKGLLAIFTYVSNLIHYLKSHLNTTSYCPTSLSAFPKSNSSFFYLPPTAKAVLKALVYKYYNLTKLWLCILYDDMGCYLFSGVVIIWLNFGGHTKFVTCMDKTFTLSV
jgi:hypothetical protein